MLKNKTEEAITYIGAIGCAPAGIWTPVGGGGPGSGLFCIPIGGGAMPIPGLGGIGAGRLAPGGIEFMPGGAGAGLGTLCGDIWLFLNRDCLIGVSNDAGL